MVEQMTSKATVCLKSKLFILAKVSIDIISLSIVDYQLANKDIDDNVPTCEWLKKIVETFPTFDTAFGRNVINESQSNWDELLAHINMATSKLLQRLYSHIKVRYPIYKTELSQRDIGFGILSNQS